MSRKLEEAYIESLMGFPTIPPAVYQKMRNSRFLELYPYFEHKTKICLSRHEKQSLTIDDCDDYLIEAAIKFSKTNEMKLDNFSGTLILEIYFV